MKDHFALSFALAAFSAAQAQTPVTVSTAPGNVEQVWYSLQNGDVGAAAMNDWDLAFEMTGFSSSILVNTAKGMLAYETPTTVGDWASLNAVDTANWTPVQNQDTSWSAGAFTHGNDLFNPDGVNVGWGIYNMVTHVITGNKVYAILTADGTTWKKIRINSLAGGTYSFTYANLDGSDLQDVQLIKTDFTGKNFGYWSFGTNATLDREPPSADWDLTFTKYTGFVPTPYAVVGVLQNKEVTALQVDGVPNDLALWTSGPLITPMNVIGSDWKTFDFNAMAYVMATDRTYFVKDLAGNIWKLVFTAYGGSANGDISFNQELVSSTGMAETGARTGSLSAWPNPVSNGQVNLLIDVPANAGMLQVFNATGRQVLQHPVSGLAGMSSRALAVDQLSPGIYSLRLEAAGTVLNTKLVVQ
jgi:uncharacterized protein YjbI with pentapeptide repeats